jgi:hypothetical protein
MGQPSGDTTGPGRRRALKSILHATREGTGSA